MVVVPLKYPTFHYKGQNVECTGILLTFFVDLHPTFGSTFPEFPKCKHMRCHCPGSQRTPLVSIRHQLGLLSLFAFAFLTSVEPTPCRRIMQEPRCPRPSPLVSRVPQVQSHALSLSWVPKDTAGLDPPSTWSSFSLCLRRFPFLHLSFLFFSSLFLSFRFHSFPFVCFALFCLSFLSFPFKNQGRRWW